jgi:hypothetical protein
MLVTVAAQLPANNAIAPLVFQPAKDDEKRAAGGRRLLGDISQKQRSRNPDSKNNDKVLQFILFHLLLPSATVIRGGEVICCCGFLDVAFNLRRMKRRSNQHVRCESKVKNDKKFWQFAATTKKLAFSGRDLLVSDKDGIFILILKAHGFLVRKSKGSDRQVQHGRNEFC